MSRWGWRLDWTFGQPTCHFPLHAHSLKLFNWLIERLNLGQIFSFWTEQVLSYGCSLLLLLLFLLSSRLTCRHDTALVCTALQQQQNRSKKTAKRTVNHCHQKTRGKSGKSSSMPRTAAAVAGDAKKKEKRYRSIEWLQNNNNGGGGDKSKEKENPFLQQQPSHRSFSKRLSSSQAQTNQPTDWQKKVELK